MAAAVIMIASVGWIGFMWSTRAPRTPLTRAAHAGDAQQVARLIQQGADPNEGGGAPLIAAARGGHRLGPHRCGPQSAAHLETIRVLLKLGADPTLTDRNGWTAATVATHHHQDEAAALLARR